MTTAVNIRTEPYDVYIGSACKYNNHPQIGYLVSNGYFDNPFKVGQTYSDVRNHKITIKDRNHSIEVYKGYFNFKIAQDPEFKSRILELKDKRLGCFCKPLPCHGDIIAEYLNNLE